jgi:hypothetical protein
MRNWQALGKMKVRRCWGARAQTSGAGIQRRSARTRSRVGRNIGLLQYGGRRGAMYLPGNAAPRTPIVSRIAELPVWHTNVTVVWVTSDLRELKNAERLSDGRRICRFSKGNRTSTASRKNAEGDE